MKERASFTFDKKTIELIDRLMELGIYRNKSHVVEHAIIALGKKKLESDNSKQEKKGGGK